MNGNKPYLAAARGKAAEEGHARTIGAERCPSNSRSSGSFDPNHAPALFGKTASGVQRNPTILGYVARATQEVSAVPYLPANRRKTSSNAMRSLREESQARGKAKFEETLIGSSVTGEKGEARPVPTSAAGRQNPCSHRSRAS